MTSPQDPSGSPESTPVQLTRIEGVLNLIHFQLGGIITDVASLDNRVGKLELSVQRLGDAADANEKTVEQTAKALKDAKEATEATARAERQKDETSWTPLSRLATAAGVVGVLVGLYSTLRPGG